jgi:hypothetical protein
MFGVGLGDQNATKGTRRLGQENHCEMRKHAQAYTNHDRVHETAAGEWISGTKQKSKREGPRIIPICSGAIGANAGQPKLISIR